MWMIACSLRVSVHSKMTCSRRYVEVVTRVDPAEYRYQGVLIERVCFRLAKKTSSGFRPLMFVSWEAWGVSATRWFDGDPASMHWITTAAGQRAVAMNDGASSPIIVRDFNPYAVRSARARAAAGGHLQQRCDWTEDLPNGNVMTLKVDDSVLAAGSVFKDDVRSSLPYVEVMTRAEYRYQGVLIDEESVLGLKVCSQKNCSSSLFFRFWFGY
jgi:hypothetical protein